MKTIKEIANELEISKEAIYKKVKNQLKQELKDHIVKKNNVTYIDDEGIKLIASTLKTHENLQSKTQTKTESEDIQPTSEPYKQVESKVENDAYISFLQEQILIKDKQIQQLTELNFELVQTFHQEQKLQAQANLLQLKSEDDSKKEIEKNDQEEPNAAKDKRNIFARIFNLKRPKKINEKNT